MFDRFKNDSFVVSMICRFFSLYRAMVQFCFSCKIVYIKCCRFYSFLLFFILNETVLSPAKFAAQTMTLLQKNEKEKEVVVKSLRIFYLVNYFLSDHEPNAVIIFILTLQILVFKNGIFNLFIIPVVP